MPVIRGRGFHSYRDYKNFAVWTRVTIGPCPLTLESPFPSRERALWHGWHDRLQCEHDVPPSAHYRDASLLLWTLLEVKRTCREHRERADLTKNDISAPTAAARLVALPISCWVMRLVKPEIAAAWKAYCG